MKKIILVLVIASSMTACISTKALTAPSAVTKTIVLTNDHNANYVKANEWMVQAFTNAESVIQFTDKEAGVVKGKYVMYAGQVGTKYAPAVESYYAMITLRVKDNGARIEIDPIGSFNVTNFMGAEYGFKPEQFTATADLLIAEFETHMNNKDANKNW